MYLPQPTMGHRWHGLLSIVVLCCLAVSPFVRADKGLEYVPPFTLWPTSPASAGISGDPSFLVAARDTVTGYTYWGAREWFGVVTDTVPDNTAQLFTLFTSASTTTKPVVKYVVVDAPTRIGYFGTETDQDIYQFNLTNPRGASPVLMYNRCCDNRAFRGLLYEPTLDLLWVITDNDIIWVNPALGPVPNPTNGQEPSNGRLHNVQNGATLGFITRDATRNNIIMAGTAIIFRTPASNNAWTGSFRKTDLESRIVGAGRYVCGAIDVTRDKIYLGSSIGIGVEVDLSSLELNRIFFAPGENILTVIFDERGVLFWSTAGSSQGSVLRVNTADFQIFSRATLPANTLRAAVFHSESNQLVYGADFGNDFRSYRVNRTNCALYQCDTCFTVDTQFCGICRNTGLCTSNEACSDTWQRNGVCPNNYNVKPTSASADAGTVLSITGSTYELDNTDCIFTDDLGTTAVTPSAITSTTVSCPVPDRSAMTTASTSAQIGVRWGSRSWGAALPYTLYHCAKMSCEQCFSGQFPECGWCLTTRSCSTASSCPNAALDWKSDSCPKIASITPSSGSLTGGETLTIHIPNLLSSQTQTFWVKFGSAPLSVKASVVAATSSLTVITEPMGLQGESLAVPINIYVGDTADTDQLYVPSPGTFTFYDCNNITQCSRCSWPQCRWCPDPELKCYFQNDAGACSSPTTTCPTLTSTNIVSALSAPYTQTTVTITGAALQFSDSPMCEWQSGAASEATPATLTGTTQATCNTPNTVTSAEYELWISATGSASTQARQTNSLPFLFYDCDANDCFNCVDPRKTGCAWCGTADAVNVANSLTCMANSDTSTNCGAGAGVEIANNQTLCPSISTLSQDGDSVVGGTVITVSGDLRLPLGATDIECEWIVRGDPLATRVSISNATVVGGNVVECAPTAVTQEYTASLRLLKNSRIYTNSIDFRFYNCSRLASCGQCLQSIYPSCSWCAVDCRAKSTCTPSLRVTTCPSIVSIDPPYTIADGGDTVYITGGPFVVDTAGRYTCRFDTIETSGRYVPSPGRIECVTPRRNQGIANVAILFNDLPYAPETLPLTVFDCTAASNSTSSGSCTDSCTAQQYCGWCITTGVCTGESKCQNSLWLEQCLEASLGPQQDHATMRGSEIIQVNLRNSSFVADKLVAGDLTCEFGRTQSVDPVRIVLADDGSGDISIECTTPKPTSEGAVDFAVLYRGEELFARFAMGFAFVDCTQLDRCDACRRKDFCGWCLDDNACTTYGTCSLRNHSSIACPSITSITPATGYTQGGETVSLAGQLFLPDIEIMTVMFGDIPIKPLTATSDAITVLAPPAPSDTEVAVAVTVVHRNNSVYSVNSGTYNYIVEPTINAAAVGGGVAAAVVVLGAAAVGAFIYVRRKYQGAINVVVREPDYVLVAYGSDLDPKFRMPDDSYKKLEVALGLKHFGLQLAIQVFCPPTEQDAVAKAMVHVAHSQGAAIDLIKTLVRVEVSQCIQENTIFRGNSLVSKMFKFYSRMVGIRYLFRCIARVIAELETLGRKQQQTQAKAKDGDGDKEASLLAMTMELDPNKIEDLEAIDADTNILQLQLTCQKLFSTIIKSAGSTFPIEFRSVFIEIDEAVMRRFGSDDAVYKAIGGFFFLRFVCPAITAPHVYGLLESPPNQLTQRQLVLISKVIQSIGNMAVPGKKEKYMEQLAKFIENGIPKVAQFYNLIRKPASAANQPIAGKGKKKDDGEDIAVGSNDIDLPKDVKNNALAGIWGFIYLNQEKLMTSISSEQVELDKKFRTEVADSVEELIYSYKTGPKKLDAKKAKKGKKTAVSTNLADM